MEEKNYLSKNMSEAKKKKDDEFYTCLSDIENELKYYKHHFKNKVVYCNCDDPRVSNFFHYFSYNFEQLGIKKLITTCYKNQQVDMFTKNEDSQAVYLQYEGEKDGGKIPTVENIGVNNLNGDGDFRSDECVELLKEADIVVTNPPFSLFREYIGQLMAYEKKFLIIGNINALTYKEVFPLIANNQVWLGYNTTRHFMKPNGDLYETARTYWYTNLDIDKTNEDLILYKSYDEKEYPKYDNYDAIHIEKTTEIPKDYEGVMGVPITFMSKYNPNQFEIIGITSGRDEFGEEAHPIKRYINPKQISKTGKITNGSKVNTRATLLLDSIPNEIYYTADNADKPLKIVYARVLIKNKRVVK